MLRPFITAVFFTLSLISTVYADELRFDYTDMSKCNADNFVCVKANDRRPLLVLLAPGEQVRVNLTGPDSEILGAEIIKESGFRVNVTRLGSATSLFEQKRSDVTCAYFNKFQRKCVSVGKEKKFFILFPEKTKVTYAGLMIDDRVPALLFEHQDVDHDEFALPDEPAPRSSAFSEFMDNFYDK